MKSNEKAKRSRVVPTFEIKLKIVSNFEAGKHAVDIRREHGILPRTVRTNVTDKSIMKLQN